MAAATAPAAVTSPKPQDPHRIGEQSRRLDLGPAVRQRLRRREFGAFRHAFADLVVHELDLAENGRRPRAPRAAHPRTRGARPAAKGRRSAGTACQHQFSARRWPRRLARTIPADSFHSLLEVGVDDGHAGKFREVLRGLGREFGAKLHARDPIPAPRERQRRLAAARADLENRVVRRDACQRDELVV